jgi:hypothetical protein
MQDFLTAHDKTGTLARAAAGESPTEDKEVRLFRLWQALAKHLDADGMSEQRQAVAFRGVYAADLNALFDYMSIHKNENDVRDFVAKGLAELYLAHIGTDTGVLSECRKAVDAAKGDAGLAVDVVLALIDRRARVYRINGRTVQNLDELIEVLVGAPAQAASPSERVNDASDWEENALPYELVERLAEDSVFLAWLYRLGHADIVERIGEVL